MDWIASAIAASQLAMDCVHRSKRIPDGFIAMTEKGWMLRCARVLPCRCEERSNAAIRKKAHGEDFFAGQGARCRRTGKMAAIRGKFGIWPSVAFKGSARLCNTARREKNRRLVNF
ncbi:MAG: hypothetical protein LBP78_00605 [Acidaminococcales bacterium]|nr:hypothetical protein [Acidaminococcales bacterium]